MEQQGGQLYKKEYEQVEGRNNLPTKCLYAYNADWIG